MLEVTNLSVTYGKHVALNDVSLHVESGEMVAILGANGAGKSSLLGAIGGRVRPTKGAIGFKGADLLALPQHRLVEQGIALVPEGRGIFPGLSVAENLMLGAHPTHARAQAEASRAQVFGLFPKLAERQSQIAGTTSGGEQQMVAIGRALMSAPQVLLLDEPFGALDAMTRDTLNMELMSVCAKANVTTILVTHSITEAAFLSDRVVVLAARPARITEVVEMPFERPRTLDLQRNAEFQDMLLRLRASLTGDH